MTQRITGGTALGLLPTLFRCIYIYGTERALVLNKLSVYGIFENSRREQKKLFVVKSKQLGGLPRSSVTAQNNKRTRKPTSVGTFDVKVLAQVASFLPVNTLCWVAAPCFGQFIAYYCTKTRENFQSSHYSVGTRQNCGLL